VDNSRERPRAIGRAAARGAAAGLLGVVVMTAAEKLEQSVTHRPNSYVPGRTLMTLLGGHPGGTDQPLVWNHAMHWGTGAVLGALRGVWAAVGLRGLRAHLAHTVVRLSFDQTLGAGMGHGTQGDLLPGHRAACRAVRAVVAGVPARDPQPLSRPKFTIAASCRAGQGIGIPPVTPTRSPVM
jgi:hypothetical protein